MMKSEDGTTTQTQFSVFLGNKPQVLTQICDRLADEKINIIAMSMMDASEHGVLRIVVTDADRTRNALNNLNVATAETTVLLTTLPNRPGALADIVGRLASNHIGVNYAYCTTGTRSGKTQGIFRVSDLKKAEKVLAERKPRRRTHATAVRSPRAKAKRGR